MQSGVEHGMFYNLGARTKSDLNRLLVKSVLLSKIVNNIHNLMPNFFCLYEPVIKQWLLLYHLLPSNQHP